MSLDILELGNYVVPAYAGMILAEQGHHVEKWTNGKDPILDCHDGWRLWRWINEGKSIRERHPRELMEFVDSPWRIILDNFRPSTLDKWGIDPRAFAERHKCVWVSMRSEMGERSFDIIAQARSWMEFAPWVPFWIGDTAGGLWMAFKALAAHVGGQCGHHIIGQASCLQKLVEGELVLNPKRKAGCIPWESETYRALSACVEVQIQGADVTRANSGTRLEAPEPPTPTRANNDLKPERNPARHASG